VETKKRRYTIGRNAVRVGPDSWIIKGRIIGMFSIQIARIWKISQRLKSIHKLVDATAKLPAKTLILLDDGQGVLSPIAVHSIVSYFNRVKGEDE